MYMYKERKMKMFSLCYVIIKKKKKEVTFILCLVKEVIANDLAMTVSCIYLAEASLILLIQQNLELTL